MQELSEQTREKLGHKNGLTPNSWDRAVHNSMCHHLCFLEADILFVLGFWGATAAGALG